MSTTPPPAQPKPAQPSLSGLLRLALIARDAGHDDDAIAMLRLLQAQAPGNVDIEANLARALFYARRWSEAWEAFDVRFRLMSSPPTVMRRSPDGTATPMPRWTGGPVPPNLLVMAEQGFGDTIQFAGYLPRLIDKGCLVTLVAPRKLHMLLAGLDSRLILMPSEEPRSLTGVKAWCSLMDVPRALALSEVELLMPLAYLRAETGRRARWALKLPRKGFRVGIAWQGNPAAPVDKNRSAPLAAFAALADLPDVHLVSLQKGPGEEQIAAVPFGNRIVRLEGLDDGDSAFLDTAAVIAELDMVVTVDTAIAHLSAALGRPTLIVLHENAADWRWLRGTDTSVFYPGVRLVRREAGADWDSAVDKVAALLSARLGASSPPASAPQPSEPAISAPTPAAALAPAAMPPAPHLPEANLAAAPVAPWMPPRGAPEARTPMPEAPISVGDLVDRITILRIKVAAIAEPQRQYNVRRELVLLEDRLKSLRLAMLDIDPVMAELHKVNQTLWDVEDQLRDCEREQRFDDEFIRLARAVYQTNDRRAALKKQINLAVGSLLIEEKSYRPY